MKAFSGIKLIKNKNNSVKMIDFGEKEGFSEKLTFFFFYF
jgi:hypothetical protein